MSLSLAAHNLKPHMSISWKEQFPALGDIKASDIRGSLEDFIPEDAFTDESREETLTDADAASFTPPGELLHSYNRDGSKFEIWKASMEDEGAQEILENAQVLVPLFIEGGTILQLDEPWVARRWTLFLVYQVHEKDAEISSYNMIGFSTSYRVFTLPDRRQPSEKDLALLEHGDVDMDTILKQWNTDIAVEASQLLKSPSQLPSRERISQFLILPTHQGSGHGAKLYNTMFTALIAPENVCELTVEDPNEAFDDMRDVCDLVWLRDNVHDFASLAISSKIDGEKLKPNANIPVDDIVDGDAKARIKKQSKIMPRQLGRLIEMQTLSKIPQNHRSIARISRKEKSSNEMDRAYYFWRLYVKQRLYITNRDVLAQLDREERAEKLEATVEHVQGDYDRLVALADRRAQLMSDDQEALNSMSSKRKRRNVIMDEDDEDDEGDTEAGDAAPTSSKKRKTT